MVYGEYSRHKRSFLEEDFGHSSEHRYLGVAEPTSLQGIENDVDYLLKEQEKESLDATNYVDSRILILYFANGFYYVCFYDTSLCEVQFLEPIQQSKNDSEVIQIVIHQFNPESVICNSRAKFQAKLNLLEIENGVRINVKSTKDFDSIEGKSFLDELVNELQQVEDNVKVDEMRSFLFRLIDLDDYNSYCCLMSAFSLNFEILSMGQNNLKKSNLIHAMNFVPINQLMNIDLESLVSLNIISLDKRLGGKKKICQMFTKTASQIGTSLMYTYLLRPLYDINAINERLNTIDYIIFELNVGSKHSLIKDIIDSIRGISDITKIIHNLRIGNYKSSVWKQLRNYLINIVKVKEYIQSSDKLGECKIFANFVESFKEEDAHIIRHKVESVLDFDADPQTISICNTVDDDLESYRNAYNEMEGILEKISMNLTHDLGLEIITAYIPQFGYLVAIEQGNNKSEVHFGNGFELVFTTSTTSYYKNEIMIEMDNKYGDLYSLIKDKEIEILFNLKNEIINDLSKIVSSYSCIGHIDVLVCFALVSMNNQFSRPKLISNDLKSNSRTIINLTGSFHPLIEKSNFVKNDLKFNKSNVMVITGPNYSGKSTILEQIGITVYLAQIGCFIPAENGELCIFKDILTRINTMDSMSTTQSTFMKDCQQMSKCLFRSSTDSLILIDEFGKGTDINDGPGLCGGIIKHYLNRNKECSTVILTTHMDEIFDSGMMEYGEGLEFSHMKVISGDDESFKVTYLYKITQGIAKDSLGLYCARQCGIDIDIIEKAQYILDIINQGKDIVSKFSDLDEIEMDTIRMQEERLKKFLQLDFQEWDVPDVKMLKQEVLKILK